MCCILCQVYRKKRLTVAYQLVNKTDTLSILLTVHWHVFAQGLSKLASQYDNPNLNYELDMTPKSNIAFQSNRTCTSTQNEMHKSTHGVVDYL